MFLGVIRRCRQNARGSTATALMRLGNTQRRSARRWQVSANASRLIAGPRGDG